MNSARVENYTARNQVSRCVIYVCATCNLGDYRSIRILEHIRESDWFLTGGVFNSRNGYFKYKRGDHWVVDLNDVCCSSSAWVTSGRSIGVDASVCLAGIKTEIVGWEGYLNNCWGIRCGIYQSINNRKIIRRICIYCCQNWSHAHWLWGYNCEECADDEK